MTMSFSGRILMEPPLYSAVKAHLGSTFLGTGAGTRSMYLVHCLLQFQSVFHFDKSTEGLVGAGTGACLGADAGADVGAYWGVQVQVQAHIRLQVKAHIGVQVHVWEQVQALVG